MASFKAEVSNQPGQAQAAERLKTKFLDLLGDKYTDTVKDVQGTWKDNDLSFSFRSVGLTFKGTLEVGTDRAKINGSLPFAAIAFKGKIEHAVKHELTQALA